MIAIVSLLGITFLSFLVSVDRYMFTLIAEKRENNVMTFSFGAASAQPATATAGAFGGAAAAAQPSFGFGASAPSSTPTLG